MGRIIAAALLASLVGAALAFNTIEYTQEIKEKVNTSREFFSNALGLVLPEDYSGLLMHNRDTACLTLEVEEISKVIRQVNIHHVATLSGTPASTPDGYQLILLEDPNGILIEVLGT